MIPLTGNNFEPIPEGFHVFKITKVDYNPDFGKMQITLQTKTGRTHTERYSLLDAKGESNPAARNAFSYFAKTVMNDYSLEEIEEQDMVGHYIRALVEHTVVESNKTPGKMLTFVKLTEKEPADCFEGETPDNTAADDDDPDDLLSSILGN